MLSRNTRLHAPLPVLPALLFAAEDQMCEKSGPTGDIGQPWSWSGAIASPDPATKVYAVVTLSDEDRTVSFNLTDSQHSFTATVPVSQHNQSDLAPVSSKRMIDLIKEAFSPSAKNKAGAETTPKACLKYTADRTPQLRIGARWGKEYEQHGVDVDIMAIPLQYEAGGTASFLQMAFDSIVQARHAITSAEGHSECVQLQIDDVQEASRRLRDAEKQEGKEHRRTIVFLNALNEYKQYCVALPSISAPSSPK